MGLGIKATSVDSLTNFQKNTKEVVLNLEKTGEPMLLTVNGKAKLVVQDAEAYQQMLDELEHSRCIASLRKALQEYEEGKSRPAEEVFQEMKAKYGF